jgi:hypothetical protein
VGLNGGIMAARPNSFRLHSSGGGEVVVVVEVCKCVV